MLVTSKRSLILGIGSLIAAPALVKASSFDAVLRGYDMDPWMIGYQVCAHADKIVSCYNDSTPNLRIITLGGRICDKLSLVEKVKELNKGEILEIGSLNNPWFIARKSELTTRDKLNIDYFLKHPTYKNGLD